MQEVEEIIVNNGNNRSPVLDIVEDSGYSSIVYSTVSGMFLFK